jgi:flagellar basal-body rod protein FlgF
MDRLLYVAMSGADQALRAQAANSHNLANVSTHGFHADLSTFRSMPVFGPGHPTRVYAMAERPGTDMSHGSIVQTGRELDVAVKTDGWIAVRSPDGTEAYTRAGDLRINTAGQLETGAGYAVLGNAGPIAIPPADKVEIAADGTISVLPHGEQASTLAVVDRIRLVKPDPAQLEKGHDGLMHLKPGSAPAQPDAAVQLVPGALEQSNVNAVEAMIGMISLARQFEMQVKMMSMAEDMDQASAQMMRVA